MSQGKILEGVFAINKPTGPSSAGVLNEVQAKFNKSNLFAPWLENEGNIRSREKANQRYRRKEKKLSVKIGHGGTLDPLATGVLVTAIGKGTKSLQGYLECTKEYEAVILFGTATDTYDRLGKVVKTAAHEHVTKDMVQENLKKFMGKYMQLPPLYSAIKMDGKPLYEYARSGKDLPRPIERRNVEVLEVELLEFMEGGTHEHKPPTEEATREDMVFLNKVWKQENIAPGVDLGKGSARDSKDRRELFERRKRKMSEEQDLLVSDRPLNKRRRGSSEAREAIMSGGLPDPEAQAIITPDEQAESAMVEKTIEAARPTSSSNASVPSSPKESKGPPACRVRMVVTSGFYVRSLCHELGPACGSAGLMAELTRTRQGEWALGKNVVDYDDLMKDEDVWGPKVETQLDGWEQKQGQARRAAILGDKGGQRELGEQSAPKAESEQKIAGEKSVEEKPVQSIESAQPAEEAKDSAPLAAVESVIQEPISEDTPMQEPATQEVKEDIPKAKTPEVSATEAAGPSISS